MLVFAAGRNWGEDAAAKHLGRSGYTVLERNWRAQFAELDIIARKDGVLVFVEVKQRKGTGFGKPSQAVDYRKQRKIKGAAQLYIIKNKITMPVRFDVIEVYGKKGLFFCRCRINHIQNAF